MPNKIAIVIQTSIADDLARVYRGLGTTAEFSEAGDDVVLVFDGSGVDSLAAISAKDHKLHGMLEGLPAEPRRRGTPDHHLLTSTGHPMRWAGRSRTCGGPVTASASLLASCPEPARPRT